LPPILSDRPRVEASHALDVVQAYRIGLRAIAADRDDSASYKWLNATELTLKKRRDRVGCSGFHIEPLTQIWCDVDCA